MPVFMINTLFVSNDTNNCFIINIMLFIEIYCFIINNTNNDDNNNYTNKTELNI